MVMYILDIYDNYIDFLLFIYYKYVYVINIKIFIVLFCVEIMILCLD